MKPRRRHCWREREGRARGPLAWGRGSGLPGQEESARPAGCSRGGSQARAQVSGETERGQEAPGRAHPDEARRGPPRAGLRAPRRCRLAPDIPFLPPECADKLPRAPGSEPGGSSRPPAVGGAAGRGRGVGGARGGGTFKLASSAPGSSAWLLERASLRRRPLQECGARHAAPPLGTAPAAVAAAAAAADPCRPRPPGPPGLAEAGGSGPRGQSRAPPCSGRPHRRALFRGQPARRGPRRRYRAGIGTPAWEGRERAPGRDSRQEGGGEGREGGMGGRESGASNRRSPVQPPSVPSVPARARLRCRRKNPLPDESCEETGPDKGREMPKVTHSQD